jgi:hypothetical protein
MNAIIPDTIVDNADHKHYVLTIDPVTGEEVKVELLPLEGVFSQETDFSEVDEDPITGDLITVH